MRGRCRGCSPEPEKEPDELPMILRPPPCEALDQYDVVHRAPHEAFAPCCLPFNGGPMPTPPGGSVLCPPVHDSHMSKGSPLTACQCQEVHTQGMEVGITGASLEIRLQR
ncbi:hypothetical protein P7K49_007432 [Saguinus oedipus]|uniref:Uncharacterized protein n=1 Tax=Saguinus oedipus TaxID=9490 RepID=A0ABQ9VVJ6_SAGOE|nr:hypothetical protein P7K49_007432 [Saguinus oedipus]